MRRLLSIALLALAACGPQQPSCGPAPAPLGEPPAFPAPGTVTWTNEREAGPSIVLEGYQEESLRDAFDAWHRVFDEAPDYVVVADELEAVDAEVNFRGSGTTGQVRLVDRCAEWRNLTVVIRPDL